MFEDLSNGVIDGIIVDDPLAQYFSVQFCNLVILDDVLYQFNYATMFTPTFSDDLILNISMAVTKLLETQQYSLISYYSIMYYID